MYKDLYIRNFRGIDDLHIEGLGTVNFFLGKNNSGKTTILESFFMLTGISNPILPEMVNSLRSKENGSFDRLKYMFHNVNIDNKPTFSATLTGEEKRNLIISLKKNVKMNVKTPTPIQTVLSSDDQSIGATCISLDYSVEKKDQEIVRSESEFCVLDNGNIVQTANKGYKEALSARFITAYTEATALREGLAELVRQNRKQEIIEKAKLFDSRIFNIEILPDSVYVGYHEIKELLPLDMCGEGLKKYLYILVSLLSVKSSIILIDEIENGLHYSAYMNLLSSIIALSQVNGVQIMISTHSKEIITTLSKMLSQENCNQYAKDEVRVYSVAETKNAGLKTYRYTSEGIMGAVECNMELRS